jgi:hypothetical protein
MAVASFEDLCAGFCELVGVETPQLSVSESGLVAFHVVLKGVTVNIVQRPDESQEHVFVLFELGHLGDEEESPAQMQALLDANHVLLQMHPPVFSRNPDNGHAVLQLIYPLFEATPNDLYEMINKGIDWTSHWREELRADDDASVDGPCNGTSLAMLHHMA